MQFSIINQNEPIGQTYFNNKGIVTDHELLNKFMT